MLKKEKKKGLDVMQKWMAVRPVGRKSVPAQCAGLAQSCVPFARLLWSQKSTLCPIGKTAVDAEKHFVSHWQDCCCCRKALCVPLARLLLLQKSALCPIGKTAVVTGKLFVSHWSQGSSLCPIGCGHREAHCVPAALCCGHRAALCVPLAGLLWSQGSSLCPIGKTAVDAEKHFVSHWQDCCGCRKALCVPLARLLLLQKSTLCPIGKTAVVTGKLLCVPLAKLLWSQGSSLCPIGKTAVVTGKLFVSHWQDCCGHREALCVPLARLLRSQGSFCSSVCSHHNQLDQSLIGSDAGVFAS